MPTPYDRIPEELKKQAQADASPKNPEKKKAERITGAEKSQKRLFKYRHGGVVLSEDDVKEIKAGRKKLRREMKARGIKSKREFELTASGLGLYFDRRIPKFLLWLWRHWLGALIGAAIALLAVLLLFSMVQQMRGHFTINMSNEMFKEGFTLSDTVGFENPTTQLFADPAVDVPCISVNQIPVDIDNIDGEHNDTYFAYTYYIRNEGDKPVDYVWDLSLNEETLSVSSAAWVALFEDGKMRLFAKPDSSTGKQEALPSFDDNSKGYISLPIKDLNPDSDQFQVVKTVGNVTYWRIIPDSFESSSVITSGSQSNVKPMDVHKYTVVIWLEGDDPDCTNALIGGHLGVEMNFRLVDEQKTNGNGGFSEFWNSLWSGLEN